MNGESRSPRQELQSLNRELTSENAELRKKIAELQGANEDLLSLLASTDLATLFLDTDLRVRSYTPAAVRLMGLTDRDVGRPLGAVAPRVGDPDLVTHAERVLENFSTLEKEVLHDSGRTYMRRITPFRRAGHRIEGVVVTFTDISSVKRASALLEQRERQQAEVANLGRMALAGTDLDDLFQAVARSLAERLTVDLTKVLRLDPDGESMLLVAGTGWRPGVVGETRFPTGASSQAGYTLQSQSPVICRDFSQEQRFHVPELLVEHGAVSGLSVAIGPEEAPWGAISAYACQEVAFTIDDINFLLNVANVLWQAIRREAMEQQLRVSEERTAAFLRNSAIAGWMKDTDGRYVFVSDTLVAHFDRDRAAWLGRTDDELWEPEVARALRSNDSAALAGDDSLEVMEELTTPDGERQYWLVSKFPFEDADGNRFVGGLGVHVTERVRAQQALAESEERMRLAARLAGFGTYYGDLSDGAFSWSPEMRRIFGIEDAEAVPGRLEALLGPVHEQDRARAVRALRKTVEPDSRGRLRHEFRIRVGTEIRWILIQGRTVFRKGPPRRASRVAGVVIDITQQHYFEEELEAARQMADAANEAKSQFLASMSHEIRTPMTAILGFAEVLRARLDDDDARACVQTIMDNGKHLCELLDDILDLEKVEAGRHEPQLTDVDVVSLLVDVRSLMSVRADEKNLDLALEILGEVPRLVRTDGRFLRQILLNLIGNAIKFTLDGSITVTCQCLVADAVLEIAVADTGIGISAEDQTLLFQPFSQLDTSLTRSPSGTGLGLAISRSLVETLDGEIRCESTPGQGSVFRVRVPTGPLEDAVWIAPAAVISDHDGAALDDLPRLSGRILVADDRREMRYLIREFIESAGGEIESADNGLAALEKWEQRRGTERAFDAVIMDIQMPVMDGLETTRRLRNGGFTGPILALTATVTQRDIERCFAAGCDDVLFKPIDRRDLLTKLTAAAAARAEPGPEERPGLLLVDDHEDSVSALKMLLEPRGYRVRTATNGDAALGAAVDQAPDVVLLDLALGEDSGEELLLRLKALPGMERCVFICVTGRRMDDGQWQKMGFDHYLAKPLVLKRLERVLADVT